MLGELQSVDGYMNIALEKTEEYVNGKLRQNYGDAFVRGNNGLFETLYFAPSLTWRIYPSSLHLCILIKFPCSGKMHHFSSSSVLTDLGMNSSLIRATPIAVRDLES